MQVFINKDISYIHSYADSYIYATPLTHFNYYVYVTSTLLLTIVTVETAYIISYTIVIFEDLNFHGLGS